MRYHPQSLRSTCQNTRFLHGLGGTVTHARIWALVAQAIGQLRWFLRPRGTVRVWLASHGLRYATFFGGDGRHTVGFFNPLLACSSRLVLDRMVACSTYVCEAGCARLPIQSPPASASDAVSPRGNARLAGCWHVRCIKTLYDWDEKRAGSYEQKA